MRDYYEMNDKLYKANETEIYDLTGCISNCHKYYYDVQQKTDLKVEVIDHAQVRECGPEVRYS